MEVYGSIVRPLAQLYFVAYGCASIIIKRKLVNKIRTISNLVAIPTLKRIVLLVLLLIGRLLCLTLWLKFTFFHYNSKKDESQVGFNNFELTLVLACCLSNLVIVLCICLLGLGWIGPVRYRRIFCQIFVTYRRIALTCRLTPHPVTINVADRQVQLFVVHHILHIVLISALSQDHVGFRLASY